MAHKLLVRRGRGTFDNWREIVVRKTGERVGWLRRDQSYSVVAWDLYDSEKNWLRGFGDQASAIRYLWRAITEDR